MADYSVLIIGAGPTGMALAAELHRYDIDFLIIDTRPSHVTTSNAAGIHARTLECWHDKPWLNALLQHGLKMKGASINTKRNRLANFNFTQLMHTQYPMILSIPQHHTEAALDSYLTSVSQPVKRNTTLLTLTPQQEVVTTTLDTPEGKKTITANWVVGCDGYHSTVRELMDIQLEGTDIKERFLLVDADFEANYEQDEYHIYLDPKGIVGFFAMKESTRIIAGIGHDSKFKDVNEPTNEIMQEIIKQRTSLSFKLKKIRWQSHFWIHERIANKFKIGRIFIAGDAAHVHSPAGGKGMNTGIKDAYNLAWKLAYVIKHKSPLSLLESYESERRPVARSVVDMTSTMTRLANMHSAFLVSLRNFVMPFISQRRFFQDTMVGRMSELSLHYRKSPIVKGKTIRSFSPGDRAFDTPLDGEQKTHLFDILNSTNQHHILVFHADNSNKNSLMALQKKYQQVLSLTFYDQSNKMILATYPFSSFTLCLIRPDQYIGFLGDNLTDLESYLQSLFLEL